MGCQNGHPKREKESDMSDGADRYPDWYGGVDVIFSDVTSQSVAQDWTWMPVRAPIYGLHHLIIAMGAKRIPRKLKKQLKKGVYLRG